MIEKAIKQRIVEALKVARPKYASASKMAVALGVNSAQLSRIVNGDTDNVLSDANWLSIARRLDVQLNDAAPWKTAATPVYQFITNQLAACQEMSLSGMLCDSADIGKTYAAKSYCRNSNNAIYVDCSQVKSKQKLIRQIAKEFGVNHTGRYADVYDDLVFYLRSIVSPIIVLDEAGDLDYPAFLELKALWNATERNCGWYMMGADGLRAKVETNRRNNKVGYAELFSRFGNKYQKVTPEGREAAMEFTRSQVSMIARANGADAQTIQRMYAATNGSLRRIYVEISKTKSN